MHDPIYMKCSETANLYSQKADQAERKAGINLNEHKKMYFGLWKCAKFLLYYSDGCIIL